jgi:hypothetical protein
MRELVRVGQVPDIPRQEKIEFVNTGGGEG